MGSQSTFIQETHRQHRSAKHLQPEANDRLKWTMVVEEQNPLAILPCKINRRAFSKTKFLDVGFSRVCLSESALIYQVPECLSARKRRL